MGAVKNHNYKRIEKFERDVREISSCSPGLSAIAEFRNSVSRVIASGPIGHEHPLPHEVVSMDAADIASLDRYETESAFWRGYRDDVCLFELQLLRDHGLRLDYLIWSGYPSVWQTEAIAADNLCDWWLRGTSGGLSVCLAYLVEYVFISAVGGPIHKTMEDYITVYSRCRIPLYVKGDTIFSYQFSPRHQIFWAKMKKGTGPARTTKKTATRSRR